MCALAVPSEFRTVKFSDCLRAETFRRCARPGNRIVLFDGETFDAARDENRLTTQLEAVKALMLPDGQYRTLAEIAAATGGSEAGVSARLRDLRKPRFGSYRVERRRVPGAAGLHEYRVFTPPRPGQQSLFDNDKSPKTQNARRARAGICANTTTTWDGDAGCQSYRTIRVSGQST
jgi:hypothetical protein